MNFDFTNEQIQLRMLVRKFVDEEIIPNVLKYDKKEDPRECVPWELIEKTLALGIGKSIIPKKYGGSELSTLDLMIITEELARGDAGLTSAIMATLHGAHIIMRYGSEEQKEKWLTMMANDKTNRFLAAGAFTEPQSGSDAMSPDPKAGIQTFARQEGDDYILNGKKCFITNGGISQFYIVWARTDKEKGAFEGGLSVFIVPADVPGLKIGNIENTLGQRLSQQAELIFEECHIPKSNLIGAEGEGFNICIDLVASSFATIGATGIGIAQSAFELAYEYSNERVQGGTQIVNHQAISYKLANILTQIEATRNLIYKSACFIDKNEIDHLLVPMCKLLGSEVAINAANDALQIFGGYGYIKGNLVEKLYRDARILSIYDSPNEAIKGGMIDIFSMYNSLNKE